MSILTKENFKLVDFTYSLKNAEVVATFETIFSDGKKNLFRLSARPNESLSLNGKTYDYVLYNQHDGSLTLTKEDNTNEVTTFKRFAEDITNYLKKWIMPVKVYIFNTGANNVYLTSDSMLVQYELDEADFSVHPPAEIGVYKFDTTEKKWNKCLYVIYENGSWAINPTSYSVNARYYYTEAEWIATGFDPKPYEMYDFVRKAWLDRRTANVVRRDILRDKTVARDHSELDPTIYTEHPASIVLYDEIYRYKTSEDPEAENYTYSRAMADLRSMTLQEFMDTHFVNAIFDSVQNNLVELTEFSKIYDEALGTNDIVKLKAIK